MAGIFGLGAGWANVPILKMIMGSPVKVTVATSGLALSVTDSTAAWIYMNKGASFTNDHGSFLGRHYAGCKNRLKAAAKSKTGVS